MPAQVIPRSEEWWDEARYAAAHDVLAEAQEREVPMNPEDEERAAGQAEQRNVMPSNWVAPQRFAGQEDPVEIRSDLTVLPRPEPPPKQTGGRNGEAGDDPVDGVRLPVVTRDPDGYNTFLIDGAASPWPEDPEKLMQAFELHMRPVHEITAVLRFVNDERERAAAELTHAIARRLGDVNLWPVWVRETLWGQSVYELVDVVLNQLRGYQDEQGRL